MKRMAWLGILLGLTVPAVAFAATAPIEASMVVTGTITVNPDGSVKAYTIKDLDKLPPGARKIVQATVPRWQFQPIKVDGKGTLAKSGMTLRIVADVVLGKSATLRVSGAQFGCNAYQAKSLLPMACQRNAAVEPIRREPPSYPIGAARAGVGGEVFLTLQVDRGGHVSQVAASQVNLYTRTANAAAYRKMFADNTIAAAKKWTFRIPTTGPGASKNHWIVRVPVSYTMDGSRARNVEYGHWIVYLPGPKNDIPWADNESKAGTHASNDAIAGNGALFMSDARFVLKTSLAGNGSKS